MRIYLTEHDRVEKSENNLVTVTLADGTVFEDLEPRRLFPITDPWHYITFLNAHSEEICVLKDPAVLSEESRRSVTDSLSEYYLEPVIQRVVSTEEKYGILRWTVETDHGPRTFDISSRAHDIRTLPDGRIRVRDSNDNRYIILDLTSLDQRSQTLIIADM